MNFDTVLNGYRHSTQIDYFLGAYVKTILPASHNPSIDIDDRPLRIIVGWTTIGLDDAAVTLLDPTTDTTNNLDTETILISELEITANAILSLPEYIKWQEKYFKVIGSIGSMLKIMSFEGSSTDVTLDLVSFISAKPLTTAEYLMIPNTSFSLANVPCNSLLKPLLDLSITFDLVNVTVADVKTIYAKLEPLDTTDSTAVTWTVSDSTLAIATVNSIESREVAIEFLQVGMVTITCKSVHDQTIVDSVTYVISA